MAIKDGFSSDLPSALSPTLSWKEEVGDVELGASIEVQPDILGAKKSLWANLARGIGGWTLKTRAEYSEGLYDYNTEGQRGVYLSMEANDEDESTFVWFAGNACTSGARPLKIGGKKVLTTDMGKIMVEPRYNFERELADACVGLEMEDTRAYLTVSGKDQNLKVVHQINDSNKASIKAGTAHGFMYARLENKSELGDSTLTVSADEIDLQMSQDGWTAGLSVSAPFMEAEPRVRFNKKLSFSV